MSREVCMDKGMCKSQTARSPRSTKMPAKKEWAILIIVHFRSWKIVCQLTGCATGLLTG